ncbi:Imidazole glycerol phosphate synthase amidotransferase subunit [hydrothermal vent metagenome]|uniref:Imidazole glycerol phosphate synthase amidotransferase subunit n=1 Tax=hydrothermal vent metagenome TaxID=652676 RepID=A0A3B1DFJ9_9ZZZZ
MIAIIDYGAGNLRSVQKALEKVGAQTQITQNPIDVQNASKVVLPGVGAMQPAMDKLKALGLMDVLYETVKTDKPFLGICVGFQLLFEKSSEGRGESSEGLGILKGSVERFTSLKVPHMGWNQLNIIQQDCPLFLGINSLAEVYFCHSYYALPVDARVTATATDYGKIFASSVARNNLFGVQFHPEKSQKVGLKILENFVKL